MFVNEYGNKNQRLVQQVSRQDFSLFFFKNPVFFFYTYNTNLSNTTAKRRIGLNEMIYEQQCKLISRFYNKHQSTQHQPFFFRLTSHEFLLTLVTITIEWKLCRNFQYSKEENVGAFLLHLLRCIFVKTLTKTLHKINFLNTIIINIITPTFFF